MKYARLNAIKKLYFGYGEIGRALSVTPESARVTANRYVGQGILLRVKRNLYILRDKWEAMTLEERFEIANVAQVPSCISLMTALGYYEVTTQVQRGFIESVAVKRTKKINVSDTVLNYTKIGQGLYFGFVKEKNFFIATPEKAFLDAVYLMSLKRYNFDLTSIDRDKLNVAKIKTIARKFPQKTREVLKKHGYPAKT